MSEQTKNLLGGNYNPDVLECLANLSNDEVFTPPKVVNQMLDMLPPETWNNPNLKFLDPACKTGVFLREIAKRLIVGLEEHRGHTNVGGFQVAELLDGVAHGVASVDDVFHDDHMATFKRMVKAYELAHDAGAFGTGIGGEFDETDLAGDGDALEQLGGKHEGAVEHYEKHGVLSLQVLVDLIGHFLYVGFDFFLGDVQPKFLV